MTDLVHKAGAQPGFVVVLEQIPDNPRFDREAREQLLDVFRDAADFWGERKIPFRCFYSFSSPLPGTRVMGRATKLTKVLPTSRRDRRQERCERELRHEHADDERRVRHRDVADRGLSRRIASHW